MGLTPLNCAVIRDHPDVCDQLVRHGADCERYIEVGKEIIKY